MQPIVAYKYKDDLEDIAAAFALDQQGTITKLLSWIKEYMDLHPELATNPHFQGVRGHPISHFRFHPTPRLELCSTPLFNSELHSTITSRVTADVK